jgi:hypothetical protein
MEVYLHPTEGQYVDKTILGPGAQLASTVLPNFILDLDSFFKP